MPAYRHGRGLPGAGLHPAALALSTATTAANATSLPRVGVPSALGLCVVNWFLPGVGYIAAGDRTRGLLLFVLINGCFLVGLSMGGYILPPEWSFKSPNFSIVACLTYIMQVFHGIGWAVGGVCWKLVQSGHPGGLVAFLAGRPGMTNSDLGSFHLLVAAGLNYFATMRLYDYLAGDPGHGRPVATGESDPQGQVDAPAGDHGGGG